MNEKNIDDELKFFITAMPSSRPADYYLGYFGGSVFIDFGNHDEVRIRLKRISFDGYGCCNLGDECVPLNEFDSMDFKEIIKAQLSDQSRLKTIIKKTILSNRNFMWEDALNEYGLI